MNDDALADANKQVNGAASCPQSKVLHVNSTEKIFVWTPCFHKAARLAFVFVLAFQNSSTFASSFCFDGYENEILSLVIPSQHI